MHPRNFGLASVIQVNFFATPRPQKNEYGVDGIKQMRLSNATVRRVIMISAMIAAACSVSVFMINVLEPPNNPIQHVAIILTTLCATLVSFSLVVVIMAINVTARPECRCDVELGVDAPIF